MEEMRVYGLVGRNISYSFSKKYFAEKFRKLLIKNARYELFDIQNIEEIENIFNVKNLKGFNVTIPFKEQIIPYLDELSEEAQAIGAINTVLFRDGKTKGFNTDVFGFRKTLDIHKKNEHQSALILGDGGAAKAVKFVFNELKIPYKTVSRKSDLNFENLSPELVSNSQIIVQCTPVGTSPQVDDVLQFPFQSLSPQHLVIDLIYNPTETAFLKKASEYNAKCCNGFYMLEQQAEKAWEIWNF